MRHHHRQRVEGRIRTAVVIAAAAMPVAACCSSALGQRVLGLDISAWQGSISQTTWNNIHNLEDRDFGFIRSSRGGTTGYYNQSDPDNDDGLNTLSQRYDDPYFIRNINRSTTAGIFAGSYHFSRPDIIASTQNSGGIPNNGTDEADHFIQMAGPWMRPGYLLPVHDFEAGAGVRTDNEMAQFCIDFSNRINQVMGIRPAIYINGNYANFVLGGASASLRAQVVAAYPTLWSARWPNQSDPDSIPVQTGHPKDSYTPIYGPWDDAPNPTHPWAFWQYASTGRLNSFNNGNSNLDFDVAQGDIEYLKDYLVPALWMNDSSGQWTTLANWSSGQTPTAPVTGPGQVAPVATGPLPTPRLPGAAGSGVTSGQHDTAILDRSNANITVTLASGTHNIRKLFMRETLNITGGSLNINYNPTYFSDTVNFPNALRSGPVSAQFSGAVSLSGTGSLSVHTLQVDATRTFTLGGGTLTFNTINLIPHSSIPAKIAVTGNVNFNPLSNATATIATGAGAGSSGAIDLGGGNRTFTIGNGTSSVDLLANVPITNGSLTKSGTGTMNLTNATLGSLDVNGGTLNSNSGGIVTVNGPLTIASGATIGVNGTLNADRISGTGAASVTGAIHIAPAASGTLSTSDATSRLNSLSITGGGKLNLANHDLIVDSGSYSAIETLVKQGFNGGNWLGNGITSSAAANDTNFMTALGVVNNADIGHTEFGGVTDLVGTEILVKYTYYGDADVGGAVNLDDFNQFLFGYNNGAGGPPAIWLNGDFDYNGSVNLDDFNLFLFGLANQGGALVSPELFAALSEFVRTEGVDADLSTVPEPAGAAIVCITSLLLRRRRKS